MSQNSNYFNKILRINYNLFITKNKHIINQFLYDKNSKYLKIKITFKYLYIIRIISKYYN